MVGTCARPSGALKLSRQESSCAQSQIEGDASPFLLNLHLRKTKQTEVTPICSNGFLLNFLSWLLKVRGTEYEIEVPGRLEVNSSLGGLLMFHPSYTLQRRNEEKFGNFVIGMKVTSLNHLFLPSIVNLNDYSLSKLGL